MIDLSPEEMVKRLMDAGWDQDAAELEVKLMLDEAETEAYGDPNEND